ncbi:MAG: HNH endonuclease [bacterium]
MKYITKLQKWALRIKKRDKNKCFICEKITKSSVAHHIYPKASYRRRALKLDNGITLCNKCHKLVHINSKSWRKYTPMFRLYMKKKDIKKFNGNKKYVTYSTYKKRKKK